MGSASTPVWYAAYGSNMHSDRFCCYLAGGRPEGGSIVLPGCRDTTAPRRSVALMPPGRIYFATESLTWTGGRAFYDPDADDPTPVRAYLISAGQFADILAQEMYRPVGSDVEPLASELAEVITSGLATLGPGRYETLVRLAEHDGIPVLTCTAPPSYRRLPGNPPSAAYLRHLGAGLAQSHGWSLPRVSRYLATRPGADLRWTPDSVATALAGRPGDDHAP